MNRTTLIAGAAVLLSTACGDVQGPESRPGSITISAPLTVVEIDGTLQLSATVLNTTGGTMPNTSVQWRSANASVAEVSAQGIVTGRSGGLTMIHAAAGSVSDSVEITVRPASCTGATTVGTLTIGSRVDGTLDAGTCLLPHGAFGEGRRLVIATPITLAITMTSSTLNALVVVTNLNLEILSYNDNSGGGNDARLLLPFQPGEYVVWATTFQGHQGDYELTVDAAETGSCTEPRGTIAVGQTVNGTLTEIDSCLLGSGHFADIWQFTAAAEVTVTADLSSTSQDSYLLLADSADTVIAADDDGGGSFNSRIVHTLTPGTYTFWASTYDPGVLGPYQLSVTAAAPGVAGGRHSADSAKARGWEALR